jgi:preprotein translocase subunit SecD
MDFYTDKKFLALLLIFAVFLAGIIMNPATVGGLLIILAVILFGSISLFWKEPHIKIGALVFLVLLAVANISLNGVTFGIDFSGGTRIPVTLDEAVDQETMGELVQTIKKRVSVFGLTQVKVRAIGDSQVNVELPSDDEETIAIVENTLSKQGVFQGIIDGKEAVNGEHIFSQSISAVPPQYLQGGADWGVQFSVDTEGAAQFAEAAKGKNDFPVYMFLDRPVDAAVFYEKEDFREFILQDSGEKESLRSMKDALSLESSSIEVYIVEDIPANLSSNGTKAIVSKNMSSLSKAAIEQMGFVLDEYDDSEMAAEFTRTRTGVLILQRFEAAGLLSAPLLNSGVTSGIQSYTYTVTGGVTATSPQEKAIEARDRVKSMESILKGGSLPVQISLGSRTTVPASLGSEFLRLSLIAIVSSLIAISVLIGLRYRNLRATAPIVLISMAELVILISILGSFTIDLAAMAGIIAAVGVGVDAQIVITDELLKKDKRKTAEKIELAFGIIKTNATVAIFAMVPLLFSGLVEIIGFAESTILGALLGYLLTRPAYATIVEKVIQTEKEQPQPI